MGTWARIIQAILVKTGSFKEKRVFGGLWSLEVQKYHRGESVLTMLVNAGHG